MDSTLLHISFRDTLSTNSFKVVRSLSGFLSDKNLSLIKAIKSELPVVSNSQPHLMGYHISC